MTATGAYTARALFAWSPRRPSRCFSIFRRRSYSQLPHYHGDLLLTQHSAGSITFQAYMEPRWNRKNELLADGGGAGRGGWPTGSGDRRIRKSG